MLLFLPVVGLEMGLNWVGPGWLCRFLGLPELVTALVLTVSPWLTTGFLHLDGFMDVTDAVKSCRTPERRWEILKDPHVGSFAVIGVLLLMLAQFVFFASVGRETPLWVLVFLPAVSRCCSALAVTVLPAMSTSQYAEQKKPRGRTELSLSEQGREEQDGIRFDISHIRFLTSSMKQANETMELLFPGVLYEQDPLFREVDFSIFEMKSYEELKDRPDYQIWLTGDNERNVPPAAKVENR